MKLKDKNPTSLDIQEITVEKKLVSELKKRGLDSKAQAIRSCGKIYEGISCPNCEFIKVIPFNCKLKICPECAKKRSRKLYATYLPIIQRFKNPMLITLTYPNVRRLDKELFKYLKTCCRNFRYSFKNKVNRIEKGLIVTETKNIGNGFNVHLHCLVDAGYIPQRRLSNVWKRVTKGKASIVDVRRVKASSGLGYVMKYISKSSDFTEVEYLVDYLESSKHIRMFQSFSITLDKKEKFRSECSLCGSNYTKGCFISELKITNEVRHMAQVETFFKSCEDWVKGEGYIT